MTAVDKSDPSYPLKHKLLTLVDDVLSHDGYGDIRVEVKILKRHQKEVILHCGKQYRFVFTDDRNTPAPKLNAPTN